MFSKGIYSKGGSEPLPPSITDAYGECEFSNCHKLPRCLQDPQPSISLLESVRLQQPSDSATFEAPGMGSYRDQENSLVEGTNRPARIDIAGKSLIDSAGLLDADN